VSARLVYSTGTGRVCPGCSRPVDACTCARPSDAPVPARVTARLRLESKGRGGKSVTIVAGLPENQAFLDDLAATLKKQCATGGTTRPGAIELSGDVRERVRRLLHARGFQVKG
jgi:translation initiation factor 1